MENYYIYDEILQDFYIPDHYLLPKEFTSVEKFRAAYRKLLPEDHYTKGFVSHRGAQVLQILLSTHHKLPSTHKLIAMLGEGETLKLPGLGAIPENSIRQTASNAGIRLSIVTTPDSVLITRNPTLRPQEESLPEIGAQLMQKLPDSALDLLPEDMQYQVRKGTLTVGVFLSLLYKAQDHLGIIRQLTRILPKGEELTNVPPLSACTIQGTTSSPLFRRLRYAAGELRLVKHPIKVAVNPTSKYDIEFTFDENGIHTEAPAGMSSGHPTLRKLNRITHTELTCHALEESNAELFIYLEFVASKASILQSQPRQLMPIEYRRQLQRRLPTGITWAKGVPH